MLNIWNILHTKFNDMRMKTFWSFGIFIGILCMPIADKLLDNLDMKKKHQQYVAINWYLSMSLEFKIKKWIWKLSNSNVPINWYFPIQQIPGCLKSLPKINSLFSPGAVLITEFWPKLKAGVFDPLDLPEQMMWQKYLKFLHSVKAFDNKH